MAIGTVMEQNKKIADAVGNIRSKVYENYGKGNTSAQNASVQTDVVNKSNNAVVNTPSVGGRVTLNLGNGPITLTPNAQGSGGVNFNGKSFDVSKGSTPTRGSLGDKGSLTMVGGTKTPPQSPAMTAPLRQGSLVSGAAVSGQGTIPQAVNNPALNENGNRIARFDNDVVLTEYFNSRPDARVYWNPTTKDVYINGIAIPKNQVHLTGGDDSKAMVQPDVVERIYQQSLSSDPTSSYTITQNYNKVLDRLYDQLGDLNRSEKFSYDYKSDPAWQAYSKYYDLLADKAVDDALTQMLARTGGYVNSNALSAAYQARNNYLQQKTNIIPTLEQHAYDRWNGQREHKNEMVNEALKNLMTYNSDFANTAYQMKQGELDRENSRYDRDYKYRALEQDAAHFASQLGVDYATLAQNDKQFYDDLYLRYLEHYANVDYRNGQLANAAAKIYSGSNKSGGNNTLVPW